MGISLIVCAVHGTNPVGCKSRYQAYVVPDRELSFPNGGMVFC